MSAQWWQSAVIYQVYPRSFADSNGDGVGDLRGVIDRLDYLSQLGIDAIWLSPFYPSPQDDNGYDISDYQAVDPVYGTLADFDELVTQAHARGIRIVLDVVLNHTSDEHPWFVASRSAKDTGPPDRTPDGMRDWYWWRPARPGLEPGTPGAEPTNWASFFSGPAWEYDQATGEYYLHLFSRKQPDLNWENPAVRQALYEMLRWWLDRGVDGFRMDVVNMVSKAVADDGSLPDGRPVPGGGALGDGTPYFICGPRIHERLHELHERVVAGCAVAPMTVGEMPGVTVDEAVLFTDPARGEVDMVFQFEHVGLDQGQSKWDVRPFRLLDLKASFGRWQAALADVGWNSLYWNNHDQPRVVSRFGDDGKYRVESAKLLGTVLHLHRGTPYVYQGEELGLTNAGFQGIEDYRDIESLNHYAAAVAAGQPVAEVLASLRVMSRDNARTPMPWDGSDQGGFTTGTPWLPLTPTYRTVNARAAVDDPDSVFHHYRRLIQLRHEEPAVGFGDFTMLLPDDEHVYAFTRTLADTRLLVLANFSSLPARIELPDPDVWAGAGLLIGNYAGTVRLARATTLRPWEAHVHRVTGRL
jgi:oligo-1,6-glucosidase